MKPHSKSALLTSTALLFTYLSWQLLFSPINSEFPQATSDKCNRSKRNALNHALIESPPQPNRALMAKPHQTNEDNIADEPLKPGVLKARQNNHELTTVIIETEITRLANETFKLVVAPIVSGQIDYCNAITIDVNTATETFEIDLAPGKYKIELENDREVVDAIEVNVLNLSRQKLPRIQCDLNKIAPYQVVGRIQFPIYKSLIESISVNSSIDVDGHTLWMPVHKIDQKDFSVRLKYPGTYRVTVEFKGYKPISLRHFTIHEDSSVIDLGLLLPKLTQPPAQIRLERGSGFNFDEYIQVQLSIDGKDSFSTIAKNKLCSAPFPIKPGTYEIRATGEAHWCRKFVTVTHSEQPQVIVIEPTKQLCAVNILCKNVDFNAPYSIETCFTEILNTTAPGQSRNPTPFESTFLLDSATNQFHKQLPTGRYNVELKPLGLSQDILISPANNTVSFDNPDMCQLMLQFKDTEPTTSSIFAHVTIVNKNRGHVMSIRDMLFESTEVTLTNLPAGACAVHIDVLGDGLTFYSQFNEILSPGETPKLTVKIPVVETPEIYNLSIQMPEIDLEKIETQSVILLRSDDFTLKVYEFGQFMQKRVHSLPIGRYDVEVWQYADFDGEYLKQATVTKLAQRLELNAVEQQALVIPN